MLKVRTNYEKEAPLKTFDQEYKVINGKKVVVYKERVKDPNEGLKASDFELNALIDADAVDLLQPVGTLQRDYLTVADFASYIAGDISNLASNVSENNEIKNEEVNE